MSGLRGDSCPGDSPANRPNPEEAREIGDNSDAVINHERQEDILDTDPEGDPGNGFSTSCVAEPISL